MLDESTKQQTIAHVLGNMGCRCEAVPWRPRRIGPRHLRSSRSRTLRRSCFLNDRLVEDVFLFFTCRAFKENAENFPLVHGGGRGCEQGLIRGGKNGGVGHRAPRGPAQGDKLSRSSLCRDLEIQPSGVSEDLHKKTVPRRDARNSSARSQGPWPGGIARRRHQKTRRCGAFSRLLHFFHPSRRGSFYFLLADGAPPLLRKGAAAMEKADEIPSFLGATASKLPFEEP